ncbi:MAG TPA: ROK family protein [Flavipsychrobacter sp.]|nr:ROK family protein [Flavipsychrobacter sp.]
MIGDLALGIDIGGTGTAYGIVSRDGKILATGEMGTTGYETIELYIDVLKRQLVPMIENVGRDRVMGIGIGAPNANFFTGEIAFAPNLPWKGIIPLARLVEEAMGLTVTITNDAKAAAIGEMMYGAARGMNDFILVTLGTGVGSGFVANGQLIYGHDGFAGELGHMIAIRNGRSCGCGRHGCLEAYASATGIARSAEEWLKERNDETMLRKYQGSITSQLIYEVALQGDAMALELYEYTGKILGQTLADAVAITSPQAIIFFGGLSKAGSLIMEPVKRHLEENVLRIYQNKVTLLYSALPDADAAILGASALVW